MIGQREVPFREVATYIDKEIERLRNFLESAQPEHATITARGNIAALRRLKDHFQPKAPADPTQTIQPSIIDEV